MQLNSYISPISFQNYYLIPTLKNYPFKLSFRVFYPSNPQDLPLAWMLPTWSLIFPASHCSVAHGATQSRLIPPHKQNGGLFSSSFTTGSLKLLTLFVEHVSCQELYLSVLLGGVCY